MVATSVPILSICNWCICLVVVSRYAHRREAEPGQLYGMGLIAIGGFAWLLLAIALYSKSPWLAVVSAILLLASGFLRISRSWQVQYLWGTWMLLWLIVPLPMNRGQQVINGLQQLSSGLSSSILDVTGIDHLMDGNTLLLPTKQFFVDEACSGIVSVMSVIACAAIYGVWRNRAPLHVAILVLAGIVWATLLNVLRITSIALVFDKWGIDWSTGTTHKLLSLVIFTLIFLGLVSTDLLLLGLLARFVRLGISFLLHRFVSAKAPSNCGTRYLPYVNKHPWRSSAHLGRPTMLREWPIGCRYVQCPSVHSRC